MEIRTLKTPSFLPTVLETDTWDNRETITAILLALDSQLEEGEAVWASWTKPQSSVSIDQPVPSITLLRNYLSGITKHGYTASLKFFAAPKPDGRWKPMPLDELFP